MIKGQVFCHNLFYSSRVCVNYYEFFHCLRPMYDLRCNEHLYFVSTHILSLSASIRLNYRYTFKLFLFFFVLYRNRPVDHPRDRVHQEYSLSLRDILPIKPKHYDKNRAPKLMGQPTIVYFHVTVLSIDSINEESMASNLKLL